MQKQLGKKMLETMRRLSFIIIIFTVLYGCSGKESHRHSSQKRKSDNWKFIFTEKKKITKYTYQDTVAVTFCFINNTGKRQYIDTVKAKCHCTDIEYPHSIIESGERGCVTLKIDLSEQYDYFSQSAVVYFHKQRPVVLKAIGFRQK